MNRLDGGDWNAPMLEAEDKYSEDHDEWETETTWKRRRPRRRWFRVQIKFSFSFSLLLFPSSVHTLYGFISKWADQKPISLRTWLEVENFRDVVSFVSPSLLLSASLRRSFPSRYSATPADQEQIQWELERESMRFNFEEPKDTPESRRSPAPKEAVQWVPLQNHPVFSSIPSSQDEPGVSQRFPRNFMAWDGDSRLYYWDSKRYLLHRLSLRLGEPEPTSVLAAVPSKVFNLSLYSPFEIGNWFL